MFFLLDLLNFSWAKALVFFRRYAEFLVDISYWPFCKMCCIPCGQKLLTFLLDLLNFLLAKVFLFLLDIVNFMRAKAIDLFDRPAEFLQSKRYWPFCSIYWFSSGKQLLVFLLDLLNFFSPKDIDLFVRSTEFLLGNSYWSFC